MVRSGFSGDLGELALRKAIGFYWTLPVTWAGFTQVDSEADQAARESRTIALQREVVQRWARQNDIELTGEHVLIEAAPDRGTDRAVQAVRALMEEAENGGVSILLVDFGAALQQRTHLRLSQFIGSHADRFELIWPDPDHEEAFRQHFASWRDAQKAWTEGKRRRIAAASARAKQLQADGHKLDAIAWQLETENLRSSSGKPWTGDMLRKVLKTELER